MQEGDYIVQDTVDSFLYLLSKQRLFSDACYLIKGILGPQETLRLREALTEEWRAEQAEAQEQDFVDPGSQFDDFTPYDTSDDEPVI